MCRSNPHQGVPSTTVTASHVTQDIVEYESSIPRSSDEGLALWEATGTLLEEVRKFMIIYRSIILRMRGVSDRSCMENKNIHLFSHFSENPAVYEIM